MKTLALLIALSACPAMAQPFRIVAQYPVRQIGPSIVAPICVSTPVVPAMYQVQVATRMGGPWMTRFGVTENNAGTNCWYIPLQASETNRFFLRAVRLP